MARPEIGRYSLSSFAKASVSSAYGNGTVSARSTTEGGKYLLDGVQDIWFTVFIPVGTDAQVDLAWVLVGLESLGDA